MSSEISLDLHSKLGVIMNSPRKKEYDYLSLRLRGRTKARIKTADEVVAIGDKVTVKVLNVDIERKRISLSIKQLNEANEGADAEEAE